MGQVLPGAAVGSPQLSGDRMTQRGRDQLWAGGLSLASWSGLASRSGLCETSADPSHPGLAPSSLDGPWSSWRPRCPP